MTVDLAGAAGRVLDAGEDPLDGYDSPHDRAAARRTDLRTSFSETLSIIAKMYRDEDWRYLTKSDGTPYRSLGEVVAEDLQVSVSMARRYVQGARDFALPLMEVVVEGTRIPVTSADIATLGSDGISHAVDIATGDLAGVTDPDESSKIIQDAIDEARATKSGPPPQPFSDTAEEDSDWEDDGSSAAPRDQGPGLVDPFNDPSDFDVPPLAPTPRVQFDDEEDPVAAILAGGTVYSDDATLAQIADPDLRALAQALRLLATIDPSALAKKVAYDTRGLLLDVDPALENASRFRSVAETQPWLVQRLAEGA